MQVEQLKTGLVIKEIFVDSMGIHPIFDVEQAIVTTFPAVGTRLKITVELDK